MKLNNYYLHAISVGEPFDCDKTLEKLEQTLSSGFLLSRRLLGDLDPNKGGFQGFNYISLCDYSKKDAPPFLNKPFYKGYTSYNSFIKLSLSLILNMKKIKIIQPELIAPCIFDWDSLEEMRRLGHHPTKRFSDMPDEVQVKNKISLKRLEGITLPLSHILNSDKSDAFKRGLIIDILKNINELLEKYNYIQSIYDLDTGIELVNETDIENVLGRIKVKN